jgi:hypothetical protein
MSFFWHYNARRYSMYAFWKKYQSFVSSLLKSGFAKAKIIGVNSMTW